MWAAREGEGRASPIREGPALLGRSIGPAFALLVLSPFLAEVLSGSTPLPLLIVFPPFAILALCLYGCAALAIRELAVRLGRGWLSIAAMGVAFAIAEEGLVVATFFDPTAPPRQAFGAWGAGPDGTNWVWIPLLCAYHSLVSICLPILIAQLAYPSRAAQPWLSKRRLVLAGVFFLFGMGLGRLLFTSGSFGAGYYARLAPWQLAASLVAIAGLAALALVLPARIHFRWPVLRAPRPVLVAAISAVTFAVFFVSGWGGKDLGLTPLQALLGAMLAAILGVAGLAVASSGVGWSDRHRLAVPAGVIAFYVLLSPVIDPPFGLAVGALSAVALWRGWRREALRAVAMR